MSKLSSIPFVVISVFYLQIMPANATGEIEKKYIIPSNMHAGLAKKCSHTFYGIICKWVAEEVLDKGKEYYDGPWQSDPYNNRNWDQEDRDRTNDYYRQKRNHDQWKKRQGI